MARRRRAREIGGMTLSTRLVAASRRTPVGLPCASWTIWPPGGSGVFAVMFARRNVTELASDSWPSWRLTHTGGVGGHASVGCLVGQFGGRPPPLAPSPPVNQPALVCAFATPP